MKGIICTLRNHSRKPTLKGIGTSIGFARRDNLYAPPGKILDVGCGMGFFIECAMNFGLQAEGIEGSQYGVQQWRRKGVRVDQQLLSQGFTYANETFATVSFTCFA